MNKLKKVLLPVKEGEMYTNIAKLNYFTMHKRYQVEKVEFSNGSGTLVIAFTDDDGDMHAITDDIFSKHFLISAN